MARGDCSGCLDSLLLLLVELRECGVMLGLKFHDRSLVLDSLTFELDLVAFMNRCNSTVILGLHVLKLCVESIDSLLLLIQIASAGLFGSTLLFLMLCAHMFGLFFISIPDRRKHTTMSLAKLLELALLAGECSIVRLGGFLDITTML